MRCRETSWLPTSNAGQDQCQRWQPLLDHSPSRWLQNTAMWNAAISPPLYFSLTSMFVYCPWAATHESGVTGSSAVTQATRTTPVHLNRYLSSSPGAGTQTNTPTHSLAPFCYHRTGITGLVLWRSAQHDHSRTNGRGDTALCMSNDWQHVGLLTGISHGEFVTCSCSPLGWCEEVCLSLRFVDSVVCLVTSLATKCN